MQFFEHRAGEIPVETGRSSHVPGGQASERRDPGRLRSSLPSALQFLTAYGVSPNVLIEASELAAANGVRPERALLASGLVDEEHYYRALARHLGLLFMGDEARLAPLASYPHSVLAGAAPLLRELPDGPVWLMAPEGARLDDLLALRRRGHLPRGRFAIATPSSLARVVIASRGDHVAAAAANDLSLRVGAAYSARGWSGSRIAPAIALSAAAIFGLWAAGGLLWNLASLAMSGILAAFITLRLLAAAASCDEQGEAGQGDLKAADLPHYTVIVALYREAAVVKQLIAALDRLDYPAARLDIKLVVEACDLDTREALEALHLPPRYQIVIAPEGQPRTKPRALNVALPLARGSLTCVFDAEDIPEPGQLREAAARFAALPVNVGCLQGRLAIDNGGDGWLARCFAIEYAALFDVVNPGLSSLGLPVPLGGTSNHFRTRVLQDIGGWDAWNVTEDIDIGFRLARFGYQTGALAASTREEAPSRLTHWLPQRRRWFKGWIQTLLVHSSSPRGTIAQMGLLRAVAAALIVVGTLAGALLGPFFAAAFVWDAFANDLLRPATPFEIVGSTLWCFVGLTGLFSAFWPVWLGMRRRGLRGFAVGVFLMPAYWVLMTVAAWWAVWDFMRDPFNWLKTEHGLAKRRAAAPDPAT